MQENAGQGHALPLKTVIFVMFTVVILVLLFLLGSMPRTTDGFQNVETTTEEYIRFQNSVFTLKNDIEDLSNRARTFVVTHNLEEAVLYFNQRQMSELKRHSPTAVENNLSDPTAVRYLQNVDELKEQMMTEQIYAMRLILEADGRSVETYPTLLQGIELSDEDSGLSAEEKVQRARDIVYGQSYNTLLHRIALKIEQYTRAENDAIFARQQHGGQQLKKNLDRQQIFIILIMAILLLSIVFILVLVLRPLSRLITDIHYGQYAEGDGAYEIQFLADSYNHFRSRMDEINQKLMFEASHDALTGLYNRGAYEEFRQMSRKREIALIIIDVDHFKEINDEYGHEAGDLALERVAYVISRSFREVDKVCRIGGDEFSVIMQNVDSSMVDIIRHKIAQMATTLRIGEENAPQITVSVGVAFSDQVHGKEALYKAADRALYRIKENGGNGCGFYVGGQT